MLQITFPESLPVSARRSEIEDALRASQVLILCGETGSGKTTQLPKIVLGLKQAKAARELAASGGKPQPNSKHRPKIIAHTQPRRIAASSVAMRIADELKTPLGDVVGYKVRFADKLSKNTQIKLMTDGILLAETQTDPDLLAYDCIIIDEAHERSLNIDFLLGYLRQLLPRRPDLTVIVTSATIDAERFAKHFASSSGSAPVITVSGRTFPVEQRYRPFEESREFDINDAIADGLDELWRNPSDQGDILVFLPGEREIREAADHLRKHLSHSPVLRSAEVLPLFARLTPAEQDKIFSPSGARRVVLATNVAETSLTVPGIRYVIDAGTARVKRYSYRNKVEQLLVEPISQAAANQRAGRCGRVANGICIRLYSDLDFAGRSPFTDPEILRSSLAGVILRMKALHLGGVEDFPFLEAPSGRAIADGYQLLNELGAVDENNEITPLGMQLSKLPLDPRLGRMLLEANERGALDEMLVIASAISVQDVRDRPMDKQAQADQAHAKFDDEKSEFVGYLKLWKWLGSPDLVPPARGDVGKADRGGDGRVANRLIGATTASPPALRVDPPFGGHKESRRQFELRLRENFISARRVREWRDIYLQLQLAAKEHLKFSPQTLRASSPQGSTFATLAPASFEALHMSLMAGLLGNIGMKSDEEDWYLGARGIKFYRHPGANLSKKPGRWIMCSELVETTRLFGRGIANIDPQWIEKVAGHILKKQLLDPHWEKKAGQVMALERATLYGLIVYHNRRVDFSKVDPDGAREVFIREALVAGNWETPLPFLQANIKMVAKVEELEHKSRRQDVLVDDELIFAFYDQLLPADVCSGHTLEKWFKQAVKSNPKLLLLSREELMRHEAAGITTDQFPKVIRLGGVDCKATYLHDPSHAADGLTVEIPIFALNQVNEERCEWLVPGMLKEKIHALLKSLPQRPRSRFVPLPASSERLTGVLCEPVIWAHGGLVDALLKRAMSETSLNILRNDFKIDMLSPHHFMNFKVVDEHGRQLGTGRNLGALKAELGKQARGAFQALAGLKLNGGNGCNGVNASADIGAAGGVELGSDKLGSDPNSRPTNYTETSNANSKLGSDPNLSVSTSSGKKYTTWSFGELPELMEINNGKQSLIGFPALIDAGDAVTIEVFDEPDVAASKHRAGLRRLVALQIKDAIKYLEKNLPDIQKMAVAYMPLGTADELKSQIIDLALDRAFLIDPLPSDEQAFKRRVEEGRGRLTLIAGEISRMVLAVLLDYAVAVRKIKDNKNATEAITDIQQQLQRLMPKRFVASTPYASLSHLPRYLKAITLRLDKWRSDGPREALKLAELRPLEQRYTRKLIEQKGVLDARLEEYRWLLEELRVSFFAQELRTPQPVSVKRLDKAWGALSL
jgi:ATP-dependent helicase HrpA